ncbi:MAG: hypothetical protein L3J92_00545 [Thermoplasmata archaeon]|nr:hypothetical protein [Thermoplasmata archaeon]
MGQHPFVNEIAGQPSTIPPRSWARRLRLPWVLTVLGVAVAVFVLLAYLPTSQSSSFQISPCSGGSGSLDVPMGTVLSVSWLYVSGSNTGILVSQDSSPLFQSALPSGNASVVVDGYGGISVYGSSDVTPCIEGFTQVHVSWQAAEMWWLVHPD